MWGLQFRELHMLLLVYVLLLVLIVIALLHSVFLSRVYSHDVLENMLVTTQNTHSQGHTLPISASALQVSLPATFHFLAGMGQKKQQSRIRLCGRIYLGTNGGISVFTCFPNNIFYFFCLAFR
jgi:hypothetical protein